MAKLYYRYGAMNSGKTTALLQVAFNYNERGMRVLAEQLDARGQPCRIPGFGEPILLD